MDGRPNAREIYTKRTSERRAGAISACETGAALRYSAKRGDVRRTAADPDGRKEPALEQEMSESLNVFGDPLDDCSNDPLTGFFRDGCCNTSPADRGSHTVCVEVSDEFLTFSRALGNDLITPRPEFGFPGLQPGNRWCLCAARWLEAHDNGVAPRVWLTRTHQRALEIVDLALLREFAVDLN